MRTVPRPSVLLCPRGGSHGRSAGYGVSVGWRCSALPRGGPCPPHTGGVLGCAPFRVRWPPGGGRWAGRAPRAGCVCCQRGTACPAGAGSTTWPRAPRNSASQVAAHVPSAAPTGRTLPRRRGTDVPGTTTLLDAGATKRPRPGPPGATWCVPTSRADHSASGAARARVRVMQRRACVWESIPTVDWSSTTWVRARLSTGPVGWWGSWQPPRPAREPLACAWGD